jgi:hypothetical protein
MEANRQPVVMVLGGDLGRRTEDILKSSHVLAALSLGHPRGNQCRRGQRWESGCNHCDDKARDRFTFGVGRFKLGSCWHASRNPFR